MCIVTRGHFITIKIFPEGGQLGAKTCSPPPLPGAAHERRRSKEVWLQLAAQVSVVTTL